MMKNYDTDFCRFKGTVKGERKGQFFKCTNPDCHAFNKIRNAHENGGMNLVVRADHGEGEVVEKPSSVTGYDKALAAKNEKRLRRLVDGNVVNNTKTDNVDSKEVVMV